MKSLVPCPACGRHVRVSESACPFCHAALPTDMAAHAIPGASQRLSRAAAFAFTATLALTGCGSNTPAPTGDAATDTSTADTASDVAADVAADRPGDAATDAPSDAPNDDGGPLAMYGGPPQDAGADVPDDDGGGMALYGLPPPDAGADVGVRYGAPPPPVDAG